MATPCLFVACTSHRVTPIAPPDFDDDSVALVVTYPDRIEAVVLDPADPDETIFFGGTDGEEVQVLLVAFSESLVTLRLTPGPLPLVGGGGRPWPRTNTVYRSRIVDEVQSEWEQLAAIPEPIASLGIDANAPDPCDVVPLAFDVANYTLDTKHSAIWALPIGENTALVATTEIDGYYEVTPDGATKTSAPPGLPNGDLWRAPNGDAYVVSRSGIYRAPPLSTAFERVADGPDEAYLLDVAGPTDPTEPFELFAIGSLGQIEHFDGSTWTKYGDPVDTFNASVVWLGPGRAAVVREALGQIEYVQDGETTLEDPLPGRMAGLTFIDRFGAYDLIVGTRSGHVLTQQNGRFEDLGQPLNDRVLEIVPFESTFLAAGSGGYLARYDPTYGFCSEVVTASHGFQILEMASGALVVHSNLDAWASENVAARRYLTVVTWLFPR